MRQATIALFGCAAALAAAGFAVAGAAAPAAKTPPAWLAYGRTPDADNVSATAFTTKQAKKMQVVWKHKVDGTLYAQPLFVPGVKIAGRSRDVLIAVTSANVVYGIDALTGMEIWHRSLGPTVPNVCGSAGGIESTPAVDPKTGLVFVMAADGRLHALAVATGKPDPSWKVPVITRTNVEVIWSGLRIAHGYVYVPVSSWCDKGDKNGAWNGRLDAVSLATHKVAHVFDVVPGPANGGGIWGPGGVSIDPRDGSVWTASANAVVYGNGNLLEKTPNAERVLRLSPTLQLRAQVVQPDNAAKLLGDQGFGSTPLLFQPPGCDPLVGVNSKDLYTYVWQRGNLSAPPVVRQAFGEDGGNTFYAEPVWVASTNTLVVDAAVDPGSGETGAVGLRLGPKCTFQIAWHANIGGGVDPQPLVAGQIVFAPATAIGKLAVLDSASGLLMNLLDTDGPAYTSPMVADGRVVVGSASGVLLAFGAFEP